jgi:hypothetical protein
MSKAITMPDDFLDGQRDCQQGEPPKQGASDDYTRGYSAQYQHEQNMSELSRRSV